MEAQGLLRLRPAPGCTIATARRPLLALFLPYGAPATDLREQRIRAVGLDPGQDPNGAATAEGAKEGEGNRLHRGARPAGKAAGREAARARLGPDSDNGKRTASYALTLGHYRHKAGYRLRLARAQKWAREVAAEHDLLSTVTRKTPCPEALGRYHAVLEDVAEAWWRNRLKPRVGNAAFTFWQRSTSALDSFAAEVHRGRARDGTLGFEGRTIVAFGDGAVGRGDFPVARLRQSFERTLGKERVDVTDEYMTSQCHTSGTKLAGILDKNHNMRGAPAGALIRGLKQYLNTSGMSCYVDRDVNAALNILSILLAKLRGEERPQHLRRDFVPFYGGADNQGAPQDT